MKRLSHKSLEQLATRTVVGAVLGTTLGVASSMLFWAIIGLLTNPQNPPTVSICSGVFCGCVYAGWPAIYGGLLGATAASLRFLWVNGVFAKGFLIVFYTLLWTIVILFGCLLRYQNRQTETAIEARFSQLCLAVSHYNYEEAYTSMSPEYRQTHTLDDFERDEEFLQRLDWYSDLYGCRWHRSSDIAVRGSAATLYPNPHSPLDLYSGPIFELHCVDGEWYFTGETSWALD